MSKIINGGLDQYGAEPFEQQQFRTSGVEGVNVYWTSDRYHSSLVVDWTKHEQDRTDHKVQSP